jgi:ribosome-associated protein
MIRISDSLSLDPRDIVETFVRASGPGGQNVNKVATAVELRYGVAGALLPDDLKTRLKVLAGRQLTQDGILVIFAQEHRSQERNRAAALAKLVSLMRRAAAAPKRRIATKPTKASKTRRLETKAKRAHTKKLRTITPAQD